MAYYEVDNGPGGELYRGMGETGRILLNVKNLLRTTMGEIPYDRKRGLDPTLFDMNMQEIKTWITMEADRVLGWEPRARLENARAELTEAGELKITVTVEI